MAHNHDVVRVQIPPPLPYTLVEEHGRPRHPVKVKIASSNLVKSALAG